MNRLGAASGHPHITAGAARLRHRHNYWTGAAAARTSDMFKALVSRGSKALQRLDERLNDEGEEDAFEEGWGEEERKALEPVSIDDVDVDDRDALRRRISKLQGMVVSMEEALEAERTSSRDTAQKLGRALQDAATVDGLVDEYGKLASEASRLSERDARTIAELAAQRDAQQTRLAVFERQLNDQDVQYAAAPSSDSTKTFAALRAAKAKIFELELELVDARKGVENGAAGRLAALDAALASVSVDAARARLESKTDPRLASRVKALEAELAARPASSTLRDAEAAAEALRSELDVLRRRVADAERDAAARPASSSSYQDAVAARDAARAEADALRTKCAAAEADTAARPSAGALRDAADARDRAMRDAADLRRRLDECEGDLKGLRIHKDDAAKARDEAERKLREHDARVLRAEKSINDIEAAADARRRRRAEDTGVGGRERGPDRGARGRRDQRRAAEDRARVPGRARGGARASEGRGAPRGRGAGQAAQAPQPRHGAPGQH